jgi:predicted dinucleotide-binding enzyme
MRIAVLGTGMVGRALAGRLNELGHEVTVGTRDVAVAAARPDVADWVTAHPTVPLQPFAEAARGADLLVNATTGQASVAALEAVGEPGRAGRILLDIANPLDFSAGFPPTLSVKDTDSLAEQIQRAFPELRVVKSLNTLTAVDRSGYGDAAAAVGAADGSAGHADVPAEGGSGGLRYLT